MRIRTVLSATAVALAAMFPLAGTAAAADGPAPRVTVHKSNGVNGVLIANAVSKVREKNRGEFTQKAVAAAFNSDGGNYNVVLMNLSHNYKDRLQNVRLYATVKWDFITYGLWIADKGQFENQGDGGYINWAYRGWFDRDGGLLRFRRP